MGVLPTVTASSGVRMVHHPVDLSQLCLPDSPVPLRLEVRMPCAVPIAGRRANTPCFAVGRTAAAEGACATRRPAGGTSYSSSESSRVTRSGAASASIGLDARMPCAVPPTGRRTSAPCCATGCATATKPSWLASCRRASEGAGEHRMLNRGRRALIRGRSPSDSRGRHPARASCPLSRCGIMPTSPGIMPTTTPGCSDMPLRAEGRDGRLRRIDEARRPGSTSSEVPFIVSFAKTESLNSGSPAGLDRHQSGLAASAWAEKYRCREGFLGASLCAIPRGFLLARECHDSCNDACNVSAHARV